MVDNDRYQELLRRAREVYPPEAVEPAMHVAESTTALQKALAEFDKGNALTPRGLVELYENVQHACWRVEHDIQAFLAAIKAKGFGKKP